MKLSYERKRGQEGDGEGGVKQSHTSFHKETVFTVDDARDLLVVSILLLQKGIPNGLFLTTYLFYAARDNSFWGWAA